MNIEQIQSFFFKAMMAGWINGGQFIPSSDAPGYKEFSFKDGDFTLVDRYCSVDDSRRSAGTTTIWFKETPVWVMNYGGWYEDRAITCLLVC